MRMIPEDHKVEGGRERERERSEVNYNTTRRMVDLPAVLIGQHSSLV